MYCLWSQCEHYAKIHCQESGYIILCVYFIILEDFFIKSFWLPVVSCGLPRKFFLPKNLDTISQNVWLPLIEIAADFDRITADVDVENTQKIHEKYAQNHGRLLVCFDTKEIPKSRSSSGRESQPTLERKIILKNLLKRR